MRMKRFLVLFPLLFQPLASAAPIFISDGSTQNVSTATNVGYDVSSGTLNLLPGADILTASATGPGALILMSGGQIENGIDILHGSLIVSGGQSRGSSSPSFGGDGVDVGQGTATITGGTFQGGNSTGQAGSGVVGQAGTAIGKPTVSTLNIGGGTFQGGTGAGGFYGGSTGYSLVSLGNTTVTGGHFQSPIVISNAYGGTTDFFGTNLSYTNHVLSGTLRNGDPINVPIYGNVGFVIANDSATEVQFVPEPASALVFGLLALAGLARRRRGRAVARSPASDQVDC
jgi:hypothetical protein